MKETAGLFFFKGRAVGRFAEYPTCSGDYSYMPYRSVGHLRLLEVKKQGGSPLCTFRATGLEVSFVVEEILSATRLRIGDFRKRKRTEPA